MAKILTVAGMLALQAVAQNVTVANVALFHGVGSDCGQNTNWVDKIQAGIYNVTGNNDTVVKCVEIGSGVRTS